VLLNNTSPPFVWVDDNWTGHGNCGGHNWGVDAFNNIHDGIDAVASGGTLDIAAGTYKVIGQGGPETDDVLTINKDGVTIQGAAGTIIDGSGAETWVTGIEIAASNVTLLNLDVRNFNCGIEISSGSGNIIEGCKVHDNNTEGIYIDSSSSNNIIRNNCEIYHNGEVGIFINGSNGNQIYGNYASIYDNGAYYAGVGIDIENGAEDNKVYNNSIYWSGDGSHIQETGIFIDDSDSGNEIYQNEIYGHDQNGIVVSDCSPKINRNEVHGNRTGIYVKGVSADASPDIRNNLIYGTSSTMDNGMKVISFMASGPAYPAIYHNTIDGGDLDGIYIQQFAGAVADPVIQYNIITNFGQYGINNNSGTPIIDYNDIWNNGSGTKDDNYYLCNPGPNDLYGVTPGDGLGKDPLYASYELQGTSPCIDKIPIGSGDPVELDFNGYTRNWDKDMGAYEYVADYTYNTSLPGGSGDVTDYRIYTIPVNLGTGSDLKAAMQGQLGLYNKNEWRVFGWNGTSYLEMDTPGFLSLPFIPGNAFWVTSFGIDPLYFSGPPAPDGDYYTITLNPGWNLFGLPWYSNNIDLGSIAVEGSGPFWITSPNNTLTQKCVWDYTGTGPDNGYVKLQSAGDTLYVGKGYWIKVLGSSAVTLLIPPDNSGEWFTATSYSGENGLKASSNSEEEPPPPPGGTSDSSGFKIEAEGGCFIATAAYGSVLHPYVKTLRDFRDTYLLSNDPGKKFVSLYYTYSPPIAELIADNAPLKYLTRLFLLPLIGFSAFMLYANPIFWFIGLIGFVLVTGYLILVTRNDPSIRNPASRIS
jgi:parallel beta-helix repeat protein